MVQTRHIIAAVLILVATLFSVSHATPKPFNQRPEVKRYINHLAKKYDFDRAKLNNLFANVTIDDRVIALMKRPYEAKSWAVYRKHFLTKQRIDGGVKFWQQHAKTLAQAQRKYGVPPSIIVAIIGVESRYGNIQGKFSVFNTLATLAFAYPKRAKFFRNELTQFLLFTREDKVDPLSIKGSYAGAMGQPQFMPSSYRHYAVDFSGNGKRDLANNPQDVIGSIANYLKENGWQRGKPIATQAMINGQKYRQLNLKIRKPTYTTTTLAKYGIKPTGKVNSAAKIKLIKLNGMSGAGPHWLGYYNFYVITTYNPSNQYAMAVYQLSQAIKKAYNHDRS